MRRTTLLCMRRDLAVIAALCTATVAVALHGMAIEAAPDQEVPQPSRDWRSLPSTMDRTSSFHDARMSSASCDISATNGFSTIVIAVQASRRSGPALI